MPIKSTSFWYREYRGDIMSKQEKDDDSHPKGIEETPEHNPTCKSKDKELDHCCSYWCKDCKGDTTYHGKHV